MKSIIFLFLMSLLSSGIFAQAKKVTYADKKQVEDFFKSKTMVVMDANPMIAYNMEVANAIKKYWTITPYEIITSAEFDEKYTDPGLSFIFLSKVQLEKDEKEVYYLYMNVVMGANVTDITDLPELLSLPLAYTGVEEEDYADKLPVMVRFVQNHINNLKEAKNLKVLYNLKNYSDDSKLLKEKTLLVKETDLSEEVNTLEKIRKEYPGPVKIVSSGEMIQAIEEETPNTAVLHQIGPSGDDNRGRAYCEVFGTDNAKLYYYNHQNITKRRPAGMSARDFHLILGKWF